MWHTCTDHNPILVDGLATKWHWASLCRSIFSFGSLWYALSWVCTHFHLTQRNSPRSLHVYMFVYGFRPCLVKWHASESRVLLVSIVSITISFMFTRSFSIEIQWLQNHQVASFQPRIPWIGLWPNLGTLALFLSIFSCLKSIEIIASEKFNHLETLATLDNGRGDKWNLLEKGEGSGSIMSVLLFFFSPFFPLQIQPPYVCPFSFNMSQKVFIIFSLPGKKMEKIKNFPFFLLG